MFVCAAHGKKRFRIDEDLCLLKEVVSADPYGNPAAWEDVLRNVVRAVLRNLTIRVIKERVDLLVGYFRQQDTVNLRKSGTEEQYGERERLLQEVSDLMRNAGYVPRTMPRKGNGMGRRRPTTSMPSATTRQCMARELRDSATASMAEALDDGQIIWMGHRHLGIHEESASDLLLSMYDSECTHPSAAEMDVRGRQDPSPDGSCVSRLTQEAAAIQSRIRGLQAMGLELLRRREEHDFLLRQKEIELQQRRLEYEERCLALQERKQASEEGRQKLDAERHEEPIKMLHSIKTTLEAQEKKSQACLNKVVAPWGRR
ncbi:hypothetical protein HPB49_009439 [Dermacentor silvarum]|uniref:Uncharacterized protein n=1 Tax=Dermacentor silvarum TaxID=543639 RepID=A0ACB8CEB5_DERSI|nr:hypothetical protein HPB49_009439 [Dermacentor silvarum]